MELIKVDGERRASTNSRGRPIATTHDGIEAFWRYFRDSKATDGQGRPLVAYHGTGWDFDTFEGYEIPGWFTDSPKKAETYSDREFTDEDGNVISAPNIVPAYLAISKPLTLAFDMNDEMTAAEVFNEAALTIPDRWKTYSCREAAWNFVNHVDFANAAIAAGFDGIEVLEDGYKTWAIFQPEQAKSVIGNPGTYNATSPHMTDGHTPQFGIKIESGQCGSVTTEYLDDEQPRRKGLRP